MFRKADNERVKLIKNTLTDEKRKQYNEKTRERMVRYRQRKKEEGRKEKKKSVTRATSQAQRMKWKEEKQKQRAAMSSQKRRRINERRTQRYAVTQFYSLVITTNVSCILYFRSVRQSPGTRWQIYWEFKVSLLKFSNMNLYVFTILLLWHYRVVSSIFCAEKFQGFLYARLQTGRIMVWWCPSVLPGLRPSVRHSFPHFSPTCFDILIWNFVYHFIFMHVRSSSNAINFRHFLQELCSFLTSNSYKYAVFRTFLLHALTYWVQILYMTLF